MTESEAKTKVCHRTIISSRIIAGAMDSSACIASKCMRWVQDRGCMDNLVFVRPEMPEVKL